MSPTRLLIFCVAALLALASAPLVSNSARAQSADSAAEPAQSTPAIGIEWQVRNRFRLFKREADFLRHLTVNRAGSILAAEQVLERDSGGRGWAQAMIDQLCVGPNGALLEACDRDGERESYLAPKSHLVVARLTGAVPQGSTCNWSFDDGTIPAKQVDAPCSAPVQQRVAFGKPTIAAVGVTRADGGVDSVSTEIGVRDIMIAGIGDSVAAGEGNPDRPVLLADDGFCFRRFLSGARSEYFRPSRQGYKGEKACDDNPAGSPTSAADWVSRGARWMSAACHRSLYGYQLRVALSLAIENPQAAVTFLPLACSGATIEKGLFGSQGASDCPLRGRCETSVPPQIEQLQDILRKAGRGLDLMLLTVGANDVKFSGLVADVIISAGIERTLFGQGGQLSTVQQSQALLERELPGNFAKLRTALKPLVGGDLSKVVYVSYGHPAMVNGEACPGGRDGLDIHPAFTADTQRLANVTAFVLDAFLPRLKSLARCEAGVRCGGDADRMTFVDAHQPEFGNRGICARSAQDPVFDRECFAADGNSFDADLVTSPNGPLVCSRRPSEFRPYASRARWIRTANDSYFTAMSFPRGLPATMQPSNIHDASWGAMSAVYGGAFHPTAEGHAAMADAAMPAARAVLGLTTPPEVEAQPLAPLR